jgi:hypothetical protein
MSGPLNDSIELPAVSWSQPVSPSLPDPEIQRIRLYHSGKSE